jgi:hypothetical protein
LLAAGIFRLLHPGLADTPSLMQNMDFYIFLRGTFVCVASLCVVWVYILVLKITKRCWFAFMAELMFCASFEFSYHSRWAVSDLIAVQFALLSTLMLFLDMSLTKRVCWGAFVAGIAAGTKYTAGIVCLNILILLMVSIQPWKNTGHAKMLIRHLIPAGILFVLAFVITTPGCIYHLKTFLHDLQMQKSIYAGGHMGYTIQPGMQHLSKILAYFALALLSPVPLASVVISLLCLTGVVHAFLKKEWNILGLFLVMFVYMTYMSLFKVMIVRNLLYVLPYFVVLAAYGLQGLHEHLKNRLIVFVVNGLLLCLLALSLDSIVAASWSIYQRDTIDMKKELALFLNEHGKNGYAFSKGVRQLLAPGNQSRDTTNGTAQFLVFLKSEIKEEHLPANTFNTYKTIAGPQDVNFDYYPTWPGQDRIVIMKLQDANLEMLKDLNMPDGAG